MALNQQPRLAALSARPHETIAKSREHDVATIRRPDRFRSAAAKRVHQMHAQAAQMNASSRQTVVQKILSSYAELLARRGCVPKKAQRSPPQPRDSSTLSSLANASSPRRRPRRVGLCWQRVRLLDLDLVQVTAGKCRRSSAACGLEVFAVTLPAIRVETALLFR